jgi:hypothetical protein
MTVHKQLCQKQRFEWPRTNLNRSRFACSAHRKVVVTNSTTAAQKKCRRKSDLVGGMAANCQNRVGESPAKLRTVEARFGASEWNRTSVGRCFVVTRHVHIVTFHYPSLHHILLVKSTHIWDLWVMQGKISCAKSVQPEVCANCVQSFWEVFGR